MGHHMITRSKKQMITRSSNKNRLVLVKNLVCSTRKLAITPRKKTKKCSIAARKPIFPIDFILDILSWLQVKPLLRLKCVCKQLQAMIQERYFIDKHLALGRIHLVFRGNEETFEPVCSCDGLVLEKCSVSKKYRIINRPLHQVFHLPDPHKNSVAMVLSFARSSSHYKAISLYSSKGENERGGFEVLTLGCEDEPMWRSLNAAYFQDFASERQFFWYCNSFKNNDGIVYFARKNKVGSGNYEVVSLDSNIECFTSTTLPRGFFIDCYKTWLVLSDDNIAFAAMSIAGHKLHFLPLLDYKKGQWAENKIVIDLKFLKDNPDINVRALVPTVASKNFVQIWEGHTVYGYNTKSEKLEWTHRPPAGQKFAYIGVHSLVTFKGMTLEKKKKNNPQ